MPSFYLSFKDFIAEIQLLSDTTIVAHKYKLDFKRKQLVKVGDFSRDVKVKVEILATASVEESLTGHTTPILAVSTQAEDDQSSFSTCYVIFVDLEKDQFIPLKKFEVSLKKIFSKHGDGGSKYQIFLLDGPCVVICHRSEVLIYYVRHGTVLEQFVFSIKNLKEDFCHCCNKSKLTIKYQNLLQSKKILDKYVLFVLLQHKSKCAEHGNEVKNIVKVLQFSGKEFSLLNTDHFFPNEYNGCLSSLHVMYMEPVGEELFNSEMYLGTTEGFIIHVRNGHLVYCNNISDNYPVTCLETGKHLSQDSSGILAGTEEVCSELTCKLQVKRKHTGIMYILTGDFYEDGSSQFLLLRHDLSSWVLTDLKTRVLSSEEGDFSDHEQTAGGSDTAIKALKARQQREQILLHEEELEARRTANFINDMFAKQVSIAAGEPSIQPSHKSDMKSLIVGPEDKKSKSQRKQTRIGNRKAIEVRGQWQRTYEDCWCIGVDVACCSDRPTKVWLDVVPDESHTNIIAMKSSCETLSTNQTDSQNSVEQVVNAETSTVDLNGSQAGVEQVVNAGASHVGKQGSIKRQKLTENKNGRLSGEFGSVNSQHEKEIIHKEYGTVVCVLPVPVFGCSNSVTANLILNWTHLESPKEFKSEVVQEVPREEDEEANNRIYTHCCGRVILHSKDILDARYELNFSVAADTEDHNMEDFTELRNNQLAWQYIQTKHSLVVKGNLGVLARFESLLTHTCGFVYNQYYDCYITMVKALGAVQVQLEPQTTDDGRLLKVYTRDEKDLFLTIHHLYAHLPDHIVLLPREPSPADIVRKCLPVLQKEADFLSHGLRKLLNDHEAENASMDTDGESYDDDIRKVGEKFKRRKERMIQKQNEVLKDEKVKQFIEQYKKVQDLTDMAISTFKK